MKKRLSWHAWELQNWPQPHPVKSWVRKQAIAQGYVGMGGMTEYLEENWGGECVVGKLGDWNGIRFKSSMHMNQLLEAVND
jgi:hypothetical protein